MTASENDDLTSYYAEVAEVMNLFGAMKMDEALDATENLIKAYPEKAEPFFFMGLLAYYYRDRGRAVEMLQQAHENEPNIREYADALANLLAMMGKTTDSLYYAKLATTLTPHEHIRDILPSQFQDYFRSLSQSRPSYHYPTAMALYNTHQIDKCVNHCEMELRVNSDHHGAHDLLGQCYLAMNDPARARQAFQSAIHFAPEIELYRLHMAKCLTYLGFYDQAILHLKNLPEPSDIDSKMIRLAAEIEILHSFPASYEDIVNARVKALQDVEPDIFKIGQTGMDNSSEKISIGYIGSHFDIDDELMFLRPILANHDRSRFEVHLFFNGANTRPSMRYLETLVDSWTPVHEVDDDTLFAIIQGNRLDVLIDLDGAYHARRSSVLSAQPANQTMCWPSARARGDFPHEKAFPSPTDVAGMAWPSPITREPIPNAPEICQAPAVVRGSVTFGAAADFRAINANTISLWARVLQAMPNAQLLLAWQGQVPAQTATYVADMFGDYGLSGRILFHRHATDDTISPYGFSYFEDIDICLDTAPSSAPDFLSEALWMGVPTVCLEDDDTGLTSIGAHVLHQAGLADWISKTQDQYVATAVALASDPSSLESTRWGLRDHVSQSRLFNPARTVSGFETYLETLKDVQV